MFSTPRKAISKYRPHPIFSSPIRLFGLFKGSSPSPTPPPSSPFPSSSPSSSSPQKPAHHVPHPTHTPRKKCYPPGQRKQSDTHAPPLKRSSPHFKLHKAPSRLGRGQRSFGARRAAPRKLGSFTVPNRSSGNQIDQLRMEANKFILTGRIALTDEDKIFLCELEKLGLQHEFRKELDAARDVADHAVDLEQLRKQRDTEAERKRAEKEQREQAERDRRAEQANRTYRFAQFQQTRLDSVRAEHVTSKKQKFLAQERQEREAALPGLREQWRAGFWAQENQREEQTREGLRLAQQTRRKEEARFAAIQRRSEIRRVEEERQQEARRQLEARMEEEARIMEQRRREEEARLVEEMRMQEEARLQHEAYMEEQARLMEARIREQVRLEEEARMREQERLMREALFQEALERERAILQETARLMEDALRDEAHRKEEARLAEEARFRAAFQSGCRVDEAMDLDDRTPSISTIIPPSNHDSYALYEQKWRILRGDEKADIPPLRFAQLPWPVLCDVVGLEQLTEPRFDEFFFSEMRPGYEGKGARARTRAELVRWHPDKFQSHVLDKISEEDRDLVLEGVGRITRFLIGK